jgi:polyhydroxyalkanoate synthesis regulator phasin|tara:strand:+ start:16205 stop:16453 length:249 start_codon:yes stop_codon:yes gene_type:complete
MEDNWKKLQAKKKDTKLEDKLARKLTHLKHVISDPDKYNSNIASKDRVESLEQQIEELQDTISKLNRRIDGLSYLIKQNINI